MELIVKYIARLIALLVVAASIAGCAGHAERYRQGLQWHLDTEAQKKALQQQGFPQYDRE